MHIIPANRLDNPILSVVPHRRILDGHETKKSIQRVTKTFSNPPLVLKRLHKSIIFKINKRQTNAKEMLLIKHDPQTIQIRQ
jgi:hypothetical protein